MCFEENAPWRDFARLAAQFLETLPGMLRSPKHFGRCLAIINASGLLVGCGDDPSASSERAPSDVASSEFRAQVSSPAGEGVPLPRERKRGGAPKLC